VPELGIDPSHVVFEIIETEKTDEMFLKEIPTVCRAAGFQIAIDDFGAG
jgi:EAL domain-containing protein (putative c-di-GMP-specific phosphodiesterase class I)